MLSKSHPLQPTCTHTADQNQKFDVVHHTQYLLHLLFFSLTFFVLKLCETTLLTFYRSSAKSQGGSYQEICYPDFQITPIGKRTDTKKFPIKHRVILHQHSSFKSSTLRNTLYNDRLTE